MKDRHATTRQWLSVPRLDPERALRELSRARTGCACSRRVATATSCAPATCTAIASRWCSRAPTTADARQPAPRVLDGAGARRAPQSLRRAALRRHRRQRGAGPGDPARRAARARSPPAQAAAVGGAVGGLQPLPRAAARRRTARALRRVRAGDVLQKTGQRRSLRCTDVAIDQARVDAGELVPTGPDAGDARDGAAARQRGGRARATRRSTPAARRARTSRAPGRDLPGARRPVIVHLELGDPAVHRLEPAARWRCACGSACPRAATQRSSIDCLLTRRRCART